MLRQNFSSVTVYLKLDNDIFDTSQIGACYLIKIKDEKRTYDCPHFMLENAVKKFLTFCESAFAGFCEQIALKKSFDLGITFCQENTHKIWSKFLNKMTAKFCK